MSRSTHRFSAILAALLPLLSACAHSRDEEALPAISGDQDLAPSLLSGKPRRREPLQAHSPPAAALPSSTARWPPPSPRGRPAPRRRSARHIQMEETGDLDGESLPDRPAGAASSAAARRRAPEEAHPAGRRAAKAAGPAGGAPGDSLSTPPLQVLPTGGAGPRAVADAGGEDQEPDGDVPAGRLAGLSTTASAPLGGDIPETDAVEPEALGAYHVQIATAPGFGRLVFERTYPFMAEIDLEGDLDRASVPSGRYWIRYSLIDLLEFEHPFSRPQRFLFSESPP